MSDFEITVEGADELITKFRQAPEIVKEEMLKGIDRLTFAGQAVSMKSSPKDTGTLRRSITQKKAVFAGGEATGAWGTNVPYAKVMEEGRGAGKPMPPSGVLLGWMRRHGIDAKAEYVVRRAIGRKGIKATHFMKQGRDAIEPKVTAEFTAVVQRIVNRITGGG
jgi:hypothetical protein